MTCCLHRMPTLNPRRIVRRNQNSRDPSTARGFRGSWLRVRGCRSSQPPRRTDWSAPLMAHVNALGLQKLTSVCFSREFSNSLRRPDEFNLNMPGANHGQTAFFSNSKSPHPYKSGAHLLSTGFSGVGIPRVGTTDHQMLRTFHRSTAWL